jgi:hypothetical protein
VAVVTNNGKSDNIGTVVSVADRYNFGARRTHGTLNLVKITNKMQPCSRINFSNLFFECSDGETKVA